MKNKRKIKNYNNLLQLKFKKKKLKKYKIKFKV